MAEGRWCRARDRKAAVRTPSSARRNDGPADDRPQSCRRSFWVSSSSSPSPSRSWPRGGCVLSASVLRRRSRAAGRLQRAHAFSRFSMTEADRWRAAAADAGDPRRAAALPAARAHRLRRSLYLIGNNPRAATSPACRAALSHACLCRPAAARRLRLAHAHRADRLGRANLAAASCREHRRGRHRRVSCRAASAASSRWSSIALRHHALNAMNLPRGRGYVQQILLGCVIIGAIFLDRIRQSRA